MARGRMTCPVCKGLGKITEDAAEHEFVTRDPQTSRCLICAGRGWIGTRTKLPNGETAGSTRRARKSAKEEEIIPDLGIDRSVPPELKQTALNVSRKKKNTTEDTEGAEWREVLTSARSKLRAYDVMDSGVGFIFIAETEPYFMPVFRFVRECCKLHDRWTEKDEESYIAALEMIADEQYAKIREANNG